jgi:hypothetical protein
MFRKLLLWYKKKAPKKAAGVFRRESAIAEKKIKKDRTRFLYSVQGNGSWERAVR